MIIINSKLIIYFLKAENFNNKSIKPSDILIETNMDKTKDNYIILYFSFEIQNKRYFPPIQIDTQILKILLW